MNMVVIVKVLGDPIEKENFTNICFSRLDNRISGRQRGLGLGQARGWY